MADIKRLREKYMILSLKEAEALIKEFDHTFISYENPEAVAAIKRIDDFYRRNQDNDRKSQKH